MPAIRPIRMSGPAAPAIAQKYRSRMDLANALMRQGSSTAPVGSMWEGLARMAQAGVGGWQARKASEEMETEESERRRAMADALDRIGKGEDPAAIAAQMPEFQDDLMRAQLAQALKPETPETYSSGKAFRGDGTSIPTRTDAQGNVAVDPTGLGNWEPMQSELYSMTLPPDVQARLRREGAPVVNQTTNVAGKLPPGWRRQNPSDLMSSAETIPGGPADLKRREALTKATSSARAALHGMRRVEALIKTVEPRIGKLTAGFGGALLSNIPGTEAADVGAEIATIQANSIIEGLAEMRRNSPTGGALGNVTEGEGRMLAARISNLEQSQTPRQLNKNLKLFRSDLAASMGRIKDAYRMDFPGADMDWAEAPSISDEDVKHTAAKYGVTEDAVRKMLRDKGVIP